MQESVRADAVPHDLQIPLAVGSFILLDVYVRIIITWLKKNPVSIPQTNPQPRTAAGHKRSQQFYLCSSPRGIENAAAESIGSTQEHSKVANIHIPRRNPSACECQSSIHCKQESWDNPRLYHKGAVQTPPLAMKRRCYFSK